MQSCTVFYLRFLFFFVNVHVLSCLSSFCLKNCHSTFFVLQKLTFVFVCLLPTQANTGEDYAEGAQVEPSRL